MRTVRRLNGTFDLVLRNTPIVGYPLCLLYLFREGVIHGKGKYHVSKAHDQLMYFFISARLFNDVSEWSFIVTLYRSGHNIDYPLREIRSSVLFAHSRFFTAGGYFPIYTHVPEPKPRLKIK